MKNFLFLFWLYLCYPCRFRPCVKKNSLKVLQQLSSRRSVLRCGRSGKSRLYLLFAQCCFYHCVKVLPLQLYVPSSKGVVATLKGCEQWPGVSKNFSHFFFLSFYWGGWCQWKVCLQAPMPLWLKKWGLHGWGGSLLLRRNYFSFYLFFNHYGCPPQLVNTVPIGTCVACI